jgi:hypothetical protein
MQVKRWVAPITAVMMVVTGLTVVGCGGDESGTASITKAAFVQKVNAACAKIQGQTQAEFRLYLESQGDGLAPSQADLGKKFVIGPKQQLVEELASLGAPSGDEDQIEAIVVAFEEGIEKAEEDPAQVARNSTEAFGTPEKLAAEYGLKGC